jgi:hypothetical protein
MEIQKTLPNTLLLKTFQISTDKSIQTGIDLAQSLFKHKLSEEVILEGHVKLRVHSFHLSLRLSFTQKWRDKELSESVESSF